MNRFRQFRDDFTSPRPNDIPPVTSPTRIGSFLETPTRSSSSEPPPLNGNVVPTLSNKNQIVPRLVTLMLLLDASSITQELVSDEFRLQQQATQQSTRELDESRNIESKLNQSIREGSVAREVEQQQQVELAQFQMFQRFLATQEEAGRSGSDSSNHT